MPYTIELLTSAKRELREARKWYESQRTGLGADFNLCIEEAIERVGHDPESYPIVLDDIRQLLVRRFPYAINYFVENDTILVIAVFHASRDPEEWIRRH
jgi:toxin ParE1/3/4